MGRTRTPRGRLGRWVRGGARLEKPREVGRFNNGVAPHPRGRRGIDTRDGHRTRRRFVGQVGRKGAGEVFPQGGSARWVAGARLGPGRFRWAQQLGGQRGRAPRRGGRTFGTRAGQGLLVFGCLVVPRPIRRRIEFPGDEIVVPFGLDVSTNTSSKLIERTGMPSKI